MPESTIKTVVAICSCTPDLAVAIPNNTYLKVNGFSPDIMKDDGGIDAAEQPTKAGIESAIKKLVADTKSGDVVFLYFSGHCRQRNDLGFDESLCLCFRTGDGKDEGICPSDNGIILDDELNDRIVKGLEKRNDITNVRVIAVVRVSVSYVC